MRRLSLLTVLLAALFFAPGCAWFVMGGVASIVFLATGDEEVNAPPAVAIDNPARLKEAPGIVSYRIFDAEGDPCSVVVEVSLDGGAFFPATQAAGSDGTFGLSSSPGGTPHVFAWDFASDLTAAEQSVQLRFHVSDAGSRGQSYDTPSFFAGNVPPEVTAISLPGEAVTGTATLKITLSDTQSDPARIEVQFLRSTGGGDWEGLGAPAAPDASPPELATSNLTTLPGGKEHLYPWDSDAAANLPGENALALIRARASEDGVEWGSWFEAAGAVDIRNDHAPLCSIPSIRLYQDGLVFVPYSVADDESHEVSVLAEYRPFGETVWKRATAGFGTTPLTFSASPAGAGGVFVWDSLKDRVYSKTVTFRLTPSQGALLGTPAERDVLIGNDQSHVWYAVRNMTSSRRWCACASAGGLIYAIGGRSQSYTPIDAVEAYDPVTDAWTSRAPLPAPASRIQAAVIEGRIHVFGGATADHRVYDPDADSWSSWLALPQTRDYPGVASIDGKLYVTGGVDSGLANRDTLYVFDPVTNAWTSGAALPVTCRNHASAGLGGKIYVAGGETNLLFTDKAVYSYDPATNAWTARASMAGVRQGFGLTVHAGKLVATGGSNFTGTGIFYLSSCEEYDPFLNSWRSLPAMPVAMESSAAAAWNGKIYAFGNTDAVVYDAWREVSFGRANLPSERDGIAGAEAGGGIFLFGGWDYSSFMTEVLRYDPLLNTYATRAALSPGRGYAGAALLNGLIYVTGGETADYVEITTVGRYNPSTNAWSAGVALPSKRSRHGCVSLGGRIWCVGGRSWNGSAYEYLSELVAFDPVTGSWSQKAPLPSARANAGCAALGGILYLAGGDDQSGPTSTLFAYDPGSDTWSAKSSLPQALSGPGLAAAGGRLAMLGGQPASGNTLSSVSLYDPDTDAWAAGPSMPSKHAFAPAVSWMGRAFIFGGYIYDGPPPMLGKVRFAACYDSARQRLFANDLDLPASAAGAAAFLLEGKLHVLGGFNESEPAMSGHAMRGVAGNVADGEPFSVGPGWSQAAPLPAAAHGAAALVFGGDAYVIGGLDSAGAGLSTFLRYDAAADSWTTLPGMTHARGYLGFAAAGGLLYAFGGEDSGAAVNYVEAYDPGTAAWAAPVPAPMSAARTRFGFAAFEGRLFAFGGNGAGNVMLSSCERYDPDHDSWASLPALPKPMAGGLCIEEGGELRMYGGQVRESASVFTVTNRVLVFDPVNGTWATDEETVLPYLARDLFGARGSASFTHRGQAETRHLCFIGGGLEGAFAKTGVFRFYTRR